MEPSREPRFPAHRRSTWGPRSAAIPLAQRRGGAPSSVPGIGSVALAVPLISARYVISILTSALIYVMLALGINVVVGYAGLLDLATSPSSRSAPTLRHDDQFRLPMRPRSPSCSELHPRRFRDRWGHAAVAQRLPGDRQPRFREIIRVTPTTPLTGADGIPGIPTGISVDGASPTDSPSGASSSTAERLLLLRRPGRGGPLRRRGHPALRGKMGRRGKAVRDDEDARGPWASNTYTTRSRLCDRGGLGGLAGQLMATHLSAISRQLPVLVLGLSDGCRAGRMGSPGGHHRRLIVSLAPEFLREFPNALSVFGVLLLVTSLPPKGILAHHLTFPWSHGRPRRAPPPVPAPLRDAGT